MGVIPKTIKMVLAASSIDIVYYENRTVNSPTIVIHVTIVISKPMSKIGSYIIYTTSPSINGHHFPISQVAGM